MVKMSEPGFSGLKDEQDKSIALMHSPIIVSIPYHGWK
jgi:hypothetical protein